MFKVWKVYVLFFFFKHWYMSKDKCNLGFYIGKKMEVMLVSVCTLVCQVCPRMCRSQVNHMWSFLKHYTLLWNRVSGLTMPWNSPWRLAGQWGICLHFSDAGTNHLPWHSLFIWVSGIKLRTWRLHDKPFTNHASPQPWVLDFHTENLQLWQLRKYLGDSFKVWAPAHTPWRYAS